MSKFSTEGNILENTETETVVKTTGNHGDKTTKYQFEAHRLLPNGEWSLVSQWFSKQVFDFKKD